MDNKTPAISPHPSAICNSRDTAFSPFGGACHTTYDSGRVEGTAPALLGSLLGKEGRVNGGLAGAERSLCFPWVAQAAEPNLKLGRYKLGVLGTVSEWLLRVRFQRFSCGSANGRNRVRRETGKE